MDDQLTVGSGRV